MTTYKVTQRCDVLYHIGLIVACNGIVIKCMSDEKVGECLKCVKCKHKSRYN